MRNAQEYRAGTDPRDPASVGADETLSLANVAGHTYRIDFTDALSLPTPWRILADQIPGTGAAALSQRYYRAVVEP